MWSWGRNDDYQLGNKIDEDVPYASLIEGLTNVVEVSAGRYHNLALKQDGTVWGWSSYEDEGEFVAEQISTKDGPLIGITAIDFTDDHILALDTNHEVWGWGDNEYGQVGTYGSSEWKDYPEKIEGISGAKQVGAGYEHSIIVLTDGTMKGLGRNSYGELAVDMGALAVQLYPFTGFKAKDAPSTDDDSDDDGSSTPVQSNEPIITTNGQISIPVGRWGETKLTDEIVLTIPVGASDETLAITVEKLLNTANLFNRGEIPVSPVFELLKSVSDNFQKPVSITIKFNPALVKEGQRISIFYYDETNLVWVEVGGEVKGDVVTAEVDHFTKFAALIVDEVKEEGIELPSFSDIAGHWSEAQIKLAVQQGIVNGYPDGTFKPNANVTRAEFSVMLTNALKLEGAGSVLSFTDEQKIGDWAKSAVAKLVDKGIVSGYEDGTFRPSANISRAELAVMAARAAGGAATDAAATSFTDDSDIPSWAKPAVAKVHAASIVSGRGDNRFAPKANATRAEAVTIILNLLKAK